MYSVKCLACSCIREMKLYFIFLIVCFISKCCSGYNILFLTPMGTKSHKIYFMGIVNELLNRGHHVTIVSSDANGKPVKNLKDVVISKNHTIQSQIKNMFDKDTAANMMGDFLLARLNLCSNGLASPEVQELKKDKYDMVMLSLFFSDCYLSLVDHFKQRNLI